MIGEVTTEPILRLERPAPRPVVTAERFGSHHPFYELATGGMATVYLARSIGPAGFERLVALKRIHPRLASEPAFVEMFLDEARVAARIHHPNVCPVFDFGEAHGTYYIAMEFLIGEALARVIEAVAARAPRSDDLWPFVATKIVADAAEGAHAAHELTDPRSGAPLHVVHRDLTPRNIFVTYAGHVSVVDFGIASATDRLHQTLSGEIRGTRGFIAPEQLRGASVDRRADIWALGVVLWEMLTLRRLFSGGGAAENNLGLNGAVIPPPSALAPGLPAGFDDVVMGALERDPSRRESTARGFAKQLVSLMKRHGAVVHATDVTDWMRELFPYGEERLRSLSTGAAAREGTEPEVRTDTLRDPTGQTAVATRVATAVTAGAQRMPHRAVRPSALVAALVAGVAIGVAALTALGTRTTAGDPRPTAPSSTSTDPTPSPTPRPHHEPAAAVIAIDVRPVEDIAAPQPPVPPVRSSTPSRRTRMPDPPTPPSELGRGTLAISTLGGWAAVYRGSQRLGNTPLEIELPEGIHVLELRSASASRTVRVTVRAGTTTRRVVDLRGEDLPPI